MNKLKVGDKVRFSREVVARTGFDEMRGEVIALKGEKLAWVDCGDTFKSEDGREQRLIPVANLRLWGNV